MNQSNLGNLIKNIQKYKFLYLMLLPGIIFFVIFRYVPMYGIIIAFKDFKFKQGILGSDWIGFHYFKLLFAAPDFYRILKNTLMISLLKLVFGFPGPIILAILLNEFRHARFKKSIQTIIYFPHFISWVVLGGIIIEFFGSTGTVNRLITMLGGESIRFLTNAFWFRVLLVLSSLWKGAGWGTIIYLAALSAVDQELYAAAYVDGANKLQRIWHITLPGITSTIVVLLILRVGTIMTVGFEQIYVLSSPMVYDIAEVFSTYIFRVGLQEGRYSYTTAIGLFRNLVSLILIITTNKIANEVGDYGIW